MRELLTKVWTQMLEVNKSLSGTKKAAIAFVALVALGGIMGVAYYSGKPDYQVLFSSLSQEDAGAITQKLSADRIPYQLMADGSAILVPAERVHELRLSLATQGLPAGGGVGFEIFDKSTFGMTDFVQKLNFKRAMQGELSRTIGQMKEVRSSRVHIAIPEKKLFGKEDTGPTASVVLQLARRGALNKDQVMGIVHLVASSVEGMKPENVTVVDTEGRLLSGGEPSDEAARLSSTQNEYRNNMERDIEKNITSMIENVVGSGKVVTRVTADMDFTKIERTEKKFDPNSQVARSEQRSESKATGAQSPGGVPGIQSNIPGGEVATMTAAAPAQNSQSQETVNYEINEVVSHIQEQVGGVKKLSIAVIVDGKYAAKEGAPAGAEKEFQPRTAEELNQLSELIKTAAGVNVGRGDQVTVQSAPFDTSKFDTDITDAKAETDRQFYMEVVKYVGIGALVLALFILILRPALGWITSTSRELEDLRAFPQTVQQMEARLGVKTGGGLEEEVDYREKVKRLMQENPKAAAEMLREWLKSRR
ncbi:MAG: flagellar M-ring protein FliF [Nitrospinae bacterium]|nr:flagellar M-ring protein FliF [Nitrospinota bacterium]